MSKQYQFRPGPIVGVVGVILVAIGAKVAYDHGYISPASAGSAAVPVVEALPDTPAVPQAAPAAVAQLPLPGTEAVAVPGPQIRILVMAWNSQMGLCFANGGPMTTSGSLMAKRGVNLKIIREDMCDKMQAQSVAFAKALKKGDPQPTDGAHFWAVMGDGSAALIAGVWDELKKLGDDYLPEVVGSAGYSRGEDKLMGPPAWKANPRAARGALISGVCRDGDWNIAQKWAADNGLKSNPDEKTWDPDAINWRCVNDFLDPPKDYVAGVCEDRPVVKDGKRNGEHHNACVNAVVTWTPGDVNVAKQKGGLVSIVSTKEYSKQMPNTIIGIRKWDRDNRGLVEKMLAAMYEGGDQVRAYPAALTRAAQASAAVYHEEQGPYWEKYYRGMVEADAQGNQVELGGSYANGIQDAMLLYGLAEGSANLFGATYTVFGNVVKQQYPKLVPSFPPVSEVLNTSYTKAVFSELGAQATKAAVPTFQASADIKQVVSQRNWSIEFETGKASLTPQSVAVMQDLANGALVADELAIEIHGHTDNTGDPARNVALSQARAAAVKAWLMQQSSTSFPADRFIKVDGKGDSEPIASNDTDTGRAKNRRVQIVLGKQ